MPKSDLSTFKAAHDPSVIVPAKINAALAKLLKEEGHEAWRYESDFTKLAGISQTHLGAYRPQFAKHIVEIRGNTMRRAWFVDPKVAAEAQSTQA